MDTISIAQNRLISGEKQDAVVLDEIEQIALGLPGQLIAKNKELAQCEFGPIRQWREVYRRISHLLPPRLFRVRVVWVTGIGEYEKVLPPKVLQIYQRAKNSGYLKGYYVAEPCYEDQLPLRHPDPWLIGTLRESFNAWRNSTDEVIVLAQWD